MANSMTDKCLDNNKQYASGQAMHKPVYPGKQPIQPSKRVAVVACMDARLDVEDLLGLQTGEAHIIRNAGGLITDDVLRSLALSQRYLDTREVMIMHHTNCGMTGFDDVAFRAQLAADSGVEPGWDVPGFTDIEAQVRESVSAVRSCGWIPHRDEVRGFVFDVAAGRITEVVV